MTVEERILALLLGSTAVTDLTGDRITPNYRTQSGDLPAVVLSFFRMGQGYHFEGADGIRRDLVEVDCMAETYAEAVALSAAVEAALSGHADADFHGIFLDTGADVYSAPQDARDRGTHRRVLNFRAFTET